MDRFEIKVEPDPILSRTALPVEKVDARIRLIVSRMIVTMHWAQGVGLAAPQVGINLRILVYKPSGGAVSALINPVITQMSETMADDVEACLSIPGLRGVVPRHKEIVVRALNEKGRSLDVRSKGLDARILQHEIDHLDGILFMQKAYANTLAFG